jgi:hypothetical protein
MDDKILTRHPDASKQGTRISRAKYDAVRQAILDTLAVNDGTYLFRELPDAVGQRLPDFDGSIGWYTTTVKLDLEARGEIARVPNQSPQQLTLTGG